MSATIVEAKRQVQWWWPDAPGGHVVDLLMRSTSMPSLRDEVDWISSHFHHCALAVVRVPSVDRRILEALTSAFADAQPSPHICLAISARALPSWIGSWTGNGSVGLLLDEVDERTPLSDITVEAIEAIRIAPAFANRARDHLRSACMLNAILGLAHEIGLCTFGSAQRPADAHFQFDYVPYPADNPSFTTS